MTATELKYELFKDIESISDEIILQKIASYIKTISQKSYDDKPLLYDPESECHANEETIEAVEESMRGEYAGVADCSSFESFKQSLGANRNKNIRHWDVNTPDGAQLNMDALYQIAPSCFTEAKDPRDH